MHARAASIDQTMLALALLQCPRHDAHYIEQTCWGSACGLVVRCGLCCSAPSEPLCCNITTLSTPITLSSAMSHQALSTSPSRPSLATTLLNTVKLSGADDTGEPGQPSVTSSPAPKRVKQSVSSPRRMLAAAAANGFWTRWGIDMSSVDVYAATDEEVIRDKAGQQTHSRVPENWEGANYRYFYRRYLVEQAQRAALQQGKNAALKLLHDRVDLSWLNEPLLAVWPKAE